MNIISDTWLFKKAADIKFKYPLAISDCFSISLSLLQEWPILFLPVYELSRDTIEKIKKEYHAKIY